MTSALAINWRSWRLHACLNGTFYAGAQAQLSDVLELAMTVDPEFVADTSR